MSVEANTELVQGTKIPLDQEQDVSVSETHDGSETEVPSNFTKKPQRTEEELASARELDERSIYIANVDYAATPQQLEAIFLKVGAVQKVTILIHRYTGFPKGYAYVAFKEKESVEKAIETLDGTLLRGRSLKIHIKKTIVYDRSERDNSGSKRGGRGGRGRGRGRGRGSYRGRNHLSESESK